MAKNSEAVAEAGPGGVRCNLAYIWCISLVAALGGLLFGYDWVVISGADLFYEKYFHLVSASEVGWAKSCALVGCLLGAVVSGGLSDRLGRKRLLLLSALLFTVSSIGTGLASSYEAFVSWRIIGGVAIGLASNLSPMYIAEIAPAHLRGRLVAVNQLTIVIGILGAQVVNWLIAVKIDHHGVDATAIEAARQSWNNTYGWRWMFTAVTMPSLLFFVGSLFIPESPRWLVKNGKADQARGILTRIGGAAQAEAAVRDIESTIGRDEVQRVRFTDLLEPKMLKILLVGVTLAVLQQWSGINSIFNYAEEIYRSAGYGISDIMFNIVITGAINLAFTLIAIGTVDHFGRRILMLIGCAGIGLSHVLIGIAYALGLKGLSVLVFTLCALGCYGMSLAPICWVLISEIFPNRHRAEGQALGSFTHWVFAALLTTFFPMMVSAFAPASVFLFFCGMMVLQLIWVKTMVPETKGVALEAMQHALGIDADP